MPTTTIEIPVILKVEYELLENPREGMQYPVRIGAVKLDGVLGIGQIMELQRIINEAENG